MWQILVLFGFLVLVILYAVKGWRRHFFTGLADFFDTQIMGEWMAWNAHNILHGHFLFPDYQANFFYPHSYSLAFGEMLWPESFLYALFHSLTGNLFFSFNATMLTVWALSGVVLFVLLRKLGVSILVSGLGSLVYCLMPYRMPYYIEFNMVLVFVFPLMLIVLLRWLESPSPKTALWFCLAYLVTATSCLYFTVMVVIVILFVFVAILNGKRELLRDRAFYISGAVVAVGVLAISAIYLYPYALLHIEGGYQRSTADYLKYFAQPMQYLDTHDAALLRWIPTPPVRFAETFLSPGTTLGLLFLLFLGWRCSVFVGNYAAMRPAGRYIGVAKFLLWTAFWGAILLQAYLGPVAWLTPFNPWLYYIAFGLIGLYIAGLFFREDGRSAPSVLLAGLATAAVVCFFISLGPILTVGPDADRLVLARGPFQNFASWDPMLHAVRGLTRFAIVILTYVVIAGCIALDRVRRQHGAIIVVLPLLAGITIYEARVMVHYKFSDHERTVGSRVVKESQHLPGQHVLMELPVGVRDPDADAIMDSIGQFPLLVNGLSGFIPDYYAKLFGWEHRKWEMDKILRWTRQVWPPVYLLVDRGWITRLSLGWRQRFPWDKIDQGWDLMDMDKRFALFRQKQRVSNSNHIVRRVRTDVLKRHAVLSFDARRTGTAPVSITIRLNQQPVKQEVPVSSGWQHFAVRLPAAAMGRIEGEEIDIDAVPASPSSHAWEIKNIGFETPE
ncbi:MAG: hypothetical protein WB783_07480 [Arenicellales bacterium]